MNPMVEDKGTVRAFMDMVSHDIMNDQQAILSYLELLLSDKALPSKAREYAQKAVTHVRTSTILIEHTKHLAEMMDMGRSRLGPIDLASITVRAAAEIPDVFPTKDIKVTVDSGKHEARVLANGGLEDLVLTLLVNAVRLDPHDDVVLEVRLRERKVGTQEYWTIEVEDRKAHLPTEVKPDDLGSISKKDSSVTVKMAGIMFAKIVSSMFGGDFEAVPLKPEGAAFRVSLRKADSG